MRVEVRPAAFDPWKEIQEYQSKRLKDKAKNGASCVFVGTMRDVNEGRQVRSMRLEHYPEMTRAQLRRVAEDARRAHGLSDVLLLHRVGEMAPGDDIVLVAVWAEHRAAAYAGNRAIMEELKATAPLWKLERTADGAERWVERNTPKELTPGPRTESPRPAPRARPRRTPSAAG